MRALSRKFAELQQATIRPQASIAGGGAQPAVEVLPVDLRMLLFISKLTD
jgi:hypothetical protein